MDAHGNPSGSDAPDRDEAAALIAASDQATLARILTLAARRLSETADADAIAGLMRDAGADGSVLPAVHALVDEAEEVRRTILPRHVEWDMDWSGTNLDGTRKYPDKPDIERVFEGEGALALMLLNEVVFLNSHHWETDWPEDARRRTSINVGCNDVFAWGCADAEGADFRDIEAVHRHWAKDPAWGTAVWCMVKRRELPQRPVAERIAKAGVWDLDALAAEHGLRPNHYDGVSLTLARRKHEAYSEWERARGREPLPFDAGWWAGWKLFTEAHPEWHDEAWQAEDDRLRDEWREANGFARDG